MEIRVQLTDTALQNLLYHCDFYYKLMKLNNQIWGEKNAFRWSTVMFKYWSPDCKVWHPDVSILAQRCCPKKNWTLSEKNVYVKFYAFTLSDMGRGLQDPDEFKIFISAYLERKSA